MWMRPGTTEKCGAALLFAVSFALCLVLAACGKSEPWRIGFVAGMSGCVAGVAAYDVTQVVLQALERRQDGRSLKETVLALREFAGLQEKSSFDAYGETIRTVFRTVIRDGKFGRLRQ